MYKNYIGGTKVNIIDILILKYMKNKKTRLDDVSKISLVEDFSLYDSLLDFKVYNNHLSLDNIFTLFNMYKNKSHKKYFRFKVKATYYSSVIDETISMYFNYIVKIPTYYKKDIKEIAVDHEFIFDESDEPHESEESELENENIVYSNYIRKINNSSNFSNRMNLISNLNVKPSVVKPIVKNELESEATILNEDSKETDDTDDIDDNDSDTNISVSSFENNESNDLFF